MKKTILIIEDLYFSYGNIRALNGINVEIKEGEIVAIIGANGAGKTTTVMSVSGILKPEKGRIIFDNYPIHNLKAHKIAKMGIIQVPEGRRIFTNMSVMENLQMGAYCFNYSKEAYKKKLDFIFHYLPQLKKRENQIAGTLSGGEQQMLAIGRALMSNPKLLLLDEPSLGLAPKIVTEIFEIIYKLNKLGITILLVEQNANLALKISNYCYVFETGYCVLSGESKGLLNNDKLIRSYLGK